MKRTTRGGCVDDAAVDVWADAWMTLRTTRGRMRDDAADDGGGCVG